MMHIRIFYNYFLHIYIGTPQIRTLKNRGALVHRKKERKGLFSMFAFLFKLIFKTANSSVISGIWLE